MRCLFPFLLALLASPCAAQVRTVVEPVEPGAAEAEVFFLNEGDEPVTLQPPETVDASRLHTGELLRLHASDRGSRLLAPGAFVKLRYGVAPPQPEAAAAAQPLVEEERTRTSGSASAGFLDNLERHEPAYIIYGDGDESLKLQFSLAVRLWENDSGDTFRFAYTQSMLWAVEAASGPIRATTYSPQFSFTHPVRLAGQPVDLAVGYVHDSTGLAGPGSRDVNRIFARASARIPLGGRWSFKVAPMGYLYFATSGLGADDIADYWGNGGFELAVEQDEGLKVSGLFRGSLETGKGAAEINLSYPLRAIWSPLPKLYIFGQLFSGYGESLLNYRAERTRFRLGVAFVR